MKRICSVGLPFNLIGESHREDGARVFGCAQGEHQRQRTQMAIWALPVDQKSPVLPRRVLNPQNKKPMRPQDLKPWRSCQLIWTRLGTT